jgi:hypothetical protein
VHKLRIVQAVQARGSSMRTIHKLRKSRFFSLRPYRRS